MEITSNIATAAATKIPKAALSSLTEVINFYHTGKIGLYLVRVKDKACTWASLSKYAKKMPYKRDRLYPSAPLEKIGLEQRLEEN